MLKSRWLLQLSTVSSRFQTAAQLVLSKRVFMFDDSSDLPKRMDSKLLLHWAPCVDQLVLESCGTDLPGMAAFVGACTQLKYLDIDCCDELSSAQADALLACCGCLEALDCRNWYVPHFVPSSLATLQVHLSNWLHFVEGSDAPKRHVEALLWRVASHTALKQLILHLGPVPVLPMVPGTQLHQLNLVALSFHIQDGTTIDLSWLHHQPTLQLRFLITILCGSLAIHSQLVEQLQGLSITMLQVEMRVKVEAEAQACWSTLVVQDSFTIDVADPDMPLLGMPQCKQRTVKLHSTELTAFTVSWAAVAQCASSNLIVASPDHAVSFLGCPGHVPAFAEPWLLCVQGPAVMGLTAPCRWQGNRVTIQNDAVSPADWEWIDDMSQE